MTIRVINLTDEALPELQGVEVYEGDLKEKCLEILNDEGHTVSYRAGGLRGMPASIPIAALIEGDDSLMSILHNQEPWLMALPRQDAHGRDTKPIAEMLCFLQIGPVKKPVITTQPSMEDAWTYDEIVIEEGEKTEIPLVIPVDVRNKQWFFAGSKSDLRMPIVFEIDQNGNVSGITNFVHRAPVNHGAQILPEDM